MTRLLMSQVRVGLEPTNLWPAAWAFLRDAAGARTYGMIYMVEMALLETERRAEWDAWYAAHQQQLLSIPGFRASQRFEAIHIAESPFVALHEVDSEDIFTGPHY